MDYAGQRSHSRENFSEMSGSLLSRPLDWDSQPGLGDVQRENFNRNQPLGAAFLGVFLLCRWRLGVCGEAARNLWRRLEDANQLGTSKPNPSPSVGYAVIWN